MNRFISISAGLIIGVIFGGGLYIGFKYLHTSPPKKEAYLISCQKLDDQIHDYNMMAAQADSFGLPYDAEQWRKYVMEDMDKPCQADDAYWVIRVIRRVEQSNNMVYTWDAEGNRIQIYREQDRVKEQTNE